MSAPCSTIYSGYAWERSKCVTSWCIEDYPLLWITIRRTSPRLFRCVMFDCAPMPFFLSAICILCGAHCPMTGWVCQWKPFWIPVDDSLKKAFYVSSRSLILLIFPFPEVRGCYSRNSKVVVACLIVTMGSTETRGFSLFLGTY